MKRSTSTLWLLATLALGTACDSDDPQVSQADPTGLGENGLKLSGIGDSIMQGFDAAPCGAAICFDEPENSFAQGTSSDVNSLYLRFEKPGLEFASVSGAGMVSGSINAAAQASRICKQAVRPNRIVVLIGANDICNASSIDAVPTAEQFGTALSETLSVLTSDRCALTKGTSIHILSVPRLDLLRSSGLAKTGVACAKIWSAFGICTPATDSPSDETLQLIATTIDGYNQVILDTVTSMQANTDPGRELSFSTDYVDTTANSSFGTYAFVPDDLSDLDCFHPSIQGQRKLACLAWESWQGTGSSADCLQ
jgi:hypothetical protein